MLHAMLLLLALSPRFLLGGISFFLYFKKHPQECACAYVYVASKGQLNQAIAKPQLAFSSPR